MKKTNFKHILSLLTAMIMIVTMSVSAFAADATVTFKGLSDGFGFGPGSEYTGTDLFDNLKGVMPGDELTQTVKFKNTADDCSYVDLYFWLLPHGEKEQNPDDNPDGAVAYGAASTVNELSEGVAKTGETVATMDDFLSQLTMRIYNGEKSDGKKIYEGVPNGSTSPIYIGKFYKNEGVDLIVELDVPADLGNEYANRTGEVDFVFHVEAFDESQLTVRKVWSDGNSKHENDEVLVNLLQDGDLADTCTLSADNNWTFTFDHLHEDYTWTVEEAEVPRGYIVEYETKGNVVTITNKTEFPYKPLDPLDLTVTKVWSGDNPNARPEYVEIALFNGSELYEIVRLSEANNWTHRWQNSRAHGNWQVLEINVPKGYTPSYSASGNVVTVTNTRTLIDTGSLNWPIAVLGGLGILLVAYGVYTMIKKRKDRV